MTPLDFLRAYVSDRRALLGDSISESPLRIEDGECVGVVLYNVGGPESLDDVESFLYNVLMDPAFFDLPVGGRLRHWLAQAVAYFQAGTLRENYEVIGGGSPLTRLSHEQARALRSHLNDRYGVPTGVQFRVYPAMRYWHPFGEEAAAQMAADGVDKVVFLPSYPQYSTATTGSALAYWQALAEAEERPPWPTTVVKEYAANPKYVQAVSERIDEALQRFPRDVREDAVLIFSAHDTAVRARHEGEDPYCCHVHSTVDQVMRFRGRDRPFYVDFRSMIGLNGWFSSSTSETLEILANHGHQSALVVPISVVTDHVTTSYGLDIEVRAEAETKGFTHFEVTAGLNTHPLFIEALGEATVAQLDLPIEVNQLRHEGDGHSQTYPLRPLHRLPRHDLNGDAAQCPDCGQRKGARQWTVPERAAEPEGPPERPVSHPDDSSTRSTESRPKEDS